MLPELLDLAAAQFNTQFRKHSCYLEFKKNVEYYLGGIQLQKGKPFCGTFLSVPVFHLMMVNMYGRNM